MSAVEAAKVIHEGIKSEFFRRGGNLEQWARITADPRKFNRVWRKILGLADGDTLPPLEYRDINPATGEKLVVENA